MKKVQLLLFVALAGLLAGCESFRNVSAVYVAADKKTYEAVAPSQARYIEADPTLTPADKRLRLNTLNTWRLRVESGERSTATTQQLVR